MYCALIERFAAAMQRDNGINFFGNDLWPGNCPDLNPAENLGSIIMDRVEDFLHQMPAELRNNRNILLNAINEVVNGLRDDSELFTRLLLTFPERINDVIEAQGGPTKW